GSPDHAAETRRRAGAAQTGGREPARHGGRRGQAARSAQEPARMIEQALLDRLEVLVTGLALTPAPKLIGVIEPHATADLPALVVSIEQNMRMGNGLRSEEHTSELQSRQYLVCRLLL